ncbi:YHYH protein [Leucothrix sargassi]|nr:YHYH protein [Leucothrix sargassi]
MGTIRLFGLSSILLLASTSVVQAHDDHCSAIKSSVEQAGFASSVVVTCNEENAILKSDTYPDHEVMTGIVGTNEQTAVPAQYAAPIRLTPTFKGEPQTRDAALGVAVNGVPIYDYTGGGEMSVADLAHHQARHDTLQTKQLDICGGHAGRGDDYHYHVKPTCMIEQMENANENPILGWAFDGFPIYGDKNPDGSMIAEGTLDVCNGQPDKVFGYRYHTSEKAPYIVQCLMGEVPDFKRLPRVSPLSPSAGGKAQPGRPPRGGVEDLKFTTAADGTRSLTYRYEGDDYYINYTPSEKANCYNFTTRTVTNGGEVKSGEYCRDNKEAKRPK